MTQQLPLSNHDQVSALLRLLADRIPGVVWATDTDLRFTASFGAGLAALGLQPSEVVGKPVSEYLQTDDANFPPLAAHYRALRGESVELEQSWQGRTYQVHVEPLVDESNIVFGCMGVAQDITERKRSEEELRRSEAKWSSVVGHAPVFIALVDQADTLQFLNRAAPGMTVQEALGKSVYDFLQPEYATIARESIARVRRTGGTAFYESVGAGPSGRLSWYETHASPVRVDGEVVGVALISSDITERKRAEIALLESERKLQTLMSNLPGMAYRCRNDPQWSMAFVSDGCSPLTGYQASELIENRAIAYADIIHPADRQAVWEQVQQALTERRRFQLEYRIRTASGDEKWVWEQGVGVFSAAGELQALEGFITDITDRKRADAAQRDTERRLATLISNLPGAVYRCKADAPWTVEFMSEGYGTLTGIPASDLVGQPGTRHSALIHPDDRQREFEAMQEAVAQKRHYQVEYRLRTATGEEKWVWEQGAGVFSESGELEAIEGFTTDITARKRAEEELAKNRAILQATIQSLPFDFFALGPEGRYVLQNATSKSHWGDVTGKRPEELNLNKDTLSLWRDNNRRRLRGERVEGDVEFPVHGKRRCFHNILAPIREGERIIGILGVNVEITDRKRAEQELQQAKDGWSDVSWNAPPN